jgi:hypothetical protein
MSPGSTTSGAFGSTPPVPDVAGTVVAGEALVAGADDEVLAGRFDDGVVVVATTGVVAAAAEPLEAEVDAEVEVDVEVDVRELAQALASSTSATAPADMPRCRRMVMLLRASWWAVTDGRSGPDSGGPGGGKVTARRRAGRVGAPGDRVRCRPRFTVR